MLAVVLISCVALVFVFAVIVGIQPPAFSITRSATIAAQPSAVFAEVNDFHKWQVWSPWAQLDPTMKTTYEGASAGTGAIYTWTGNNKVGQGRMVMTESRPSDLIRIELEMMKPVAARNTVEFTFQPQGAATQVIWTMTGKNNFMGKAFSLVMNMDKMIGGQFENGLTRLKAVVEAPRQTL